MGEGGSERMGWGAIIGSEFKNGYVIARSVDSTALSNLPTHSSLNKNGTGMAVTVTNCAN